MPKSEHKFTDRLRNFLTRKKASEQISHPSNPPDVTGPTVTTTADVVEVIATGTVALDSEAGKANTAGTKAETTSNATDTSTPAPPHERSAAQIGWSLLKSVMKSAGEACVMFPPAQTALLGIAALMEMVDTIKEAQEGDLKIAHKIQDVSKIFDEYRRKGYVPPVHQQNLIFLFCPSASLLPPKSGPKAGRVRKIPVPSFSNFGHYLRSFRSALGANMPSFRTTLGVTWTADCAPL